MFVAMVRWLKDAANAWSQSQAGANFTCGDCELNARCGRAPDELCIARAAQIARGLPPKSQRWPMLPVG